MVVCGERFFVFALLGTSVWTDDVRTLTFLKVLLGKIIVY